MATIYFPSCNFTAASPEAARRLRAYMEGQMPVADCCRTDKKAYPPGDTAVYFCQACRETIDSREDMPLAPENLFVYIDRQGEFPFPRYSGLTVNVQDCWRDRAHPEIADAVRSLLHKMGVQVVEMAENRENSVFCGNLHFEPRRAENRAILTQNPDTPLYKLSPKEQAMLMAEQVEKLTCPLAVTTCNRCTAGIKAGGGQAVHLVELLMGTYA